MKTIYHLVPGEVRSANDGQRNHLTYADLIRLYGLNPSECLPAPPELLRKLPRDAIVLGPRYDGDYRGQLRRERTRVTILRRISRRKTKPVTSLDRLMVLVAQRRSVYVGGAFGLKPAAWIASLQASFVHRLLGSMIEYPAGKKTRAARQPNGLMQETRPCSQCRHFIAGLLEGTEVSRCTKKFMGVTSDLKVTFKANEGSCFQSKRFPKRGFNPRGGTQ